VKYLVVVYVPSLTSNDLTETFKPSMKSYDVKPCPLVAPKETYESLLPAVSSKSV
jgi:hypothetical protein